MRLCHVTTYPPDLLQTHYARTPELDGAAYAAQHERLLARLYSWCDFIVTRVRERGGSGSVIVANDTRAQQQWARERGLRDAGRDAILLAQIREAQPDVLFFQDSYSFSAPLVREAKGLLPKGGLVSGYSGLASVPPRAPGMIGELDVLAVAGWAIADQFPVRARSTIVMGHGFETSILDRVPGAGPRIPASFIGGLGTSLHGPRRELLETVATAVPLTLYSGTLRATPKAALRQFAAAVVRRQLGAHLKLLTSPLNRAAAPPVYGSDMYDVLRRTDISFNQQGGNVTFYVPNMRLFEVTGCGSCIVTDARPGIERLFEPDSEIVTYRSKEELAEKVAWLAAHPRERAGIAAAGQRRTLKDHPFHSRVDELLTEFESRL
jgi:spore maturation protein CgeB